MPGLLEKPRGPLVLQEIWHFRFSTGRSSASALFLFSSPVQIKDNIATSY